MAAANGTATASSTAVNSAIPQQSIPKARKVTRK